LLLLKNGEVYAPNYLGKKDVLLTFDKIACIKDEIKDDELSFPVNIVDATNLVIVPGFIDSHVHISGGGGEGGFATRTPELTLSDCIKSGITTVIGVIGTDGTTRTMPNLLAKCHSLNEEGITSYIYTGSYHTPIKTLTGKIEDDIILIDRIIGVGEVAISDHRSSQPTVQEIAQIAAKARNGGLISGKAGIVNIHVGDGKDQLTLLEEIIENTELPITQFYPTHINRNPSLFEAGIKYAKKGGIVDFTTSTIPQFRQKGEVTCSKGLKRMLDEGVPIENITFTSDGQGSLPNFDEQGMLVGLKVGKVSSLFDAVRDAILNEDIPIETALKVITSNPARILKLHTKGQIITGNDGDLILLNKDDLSIHTVIAKGKVMLEDQKVIVKGTFEE
jgi:beta-aspartyl-dipeptidase (metallo-type)